ncbi:hypothetical protein CYMTET_35541, partial [Cymbomonas tetramitiformis]
GACRGLPLRHHDGEANMLFAEDVRAKALFTSPNGKDAMSLLDTKKRSGPQRDAGGSRKHVFRPRESNDESAEMDGPGVVSGSYNNKAVRAQASSRHCRIIPHAISDPENSCVIRRSGKPQRIAVANPFSVENPPPPSPPPSACEPSEWQLAPQDQARKETGEEPLLQHEAVDGGGVSPKYSGALLSRPRTLAYLGIAFHLGRS